MPNKMLIDSSHPEETRVVVTRGNRIEEFDFESQDKKQLKGNIYLARVTRVEPSLQAAFVEYGGNRHGFLAFSEIHPDYYQIPMADRQALLRAEAEAAESEDDDDDAEERGERRGRRRRRGRGRDREERQAGGTASEETAAADGEEADEASVSLEPFSDEATDAAPGDEPTVEDDAGAIAAQAEHTEESAASGDADGAAGAGETASGDHESQPDDVTSDRPPSMAAAIDGDVISSPVPEKDDATATGEDKADDEHADAGEHAAPEERGGSDNGGVEEVSSSHGEDNEVESVGAEDALEEIRSSRRPMRRNYKIQEVIKRRQILLVQVVKEERGNKGAALTTYLSLAGRYSVLMPNTARGGGISRKITNAQDRKRLKEVVADLDVPQGMGVILRTAGESRTKAEIKRDYEYLMRLWENVRTLTLQSTAPALVYEEGSLIKRSVRDLYNKDIDEILVAGEDGYREAKDFMRMLMPSHAKVVQPYRDSVPIFARSGIEAQLDRMLQPQVTLKSGGYIIINQTEALVSIDVNSGRSTREHSIEDTALQTNLEAAEEVARQLRLRDLAGLIVIDFIDMEENRNNRSVEKRLKDCLKNDRARIQVGRISHFGLLEMSRQRIRASVLESTMKPCPHCGGTGHVRSDSSVALHVVRAIEEFLLKDARNHINVKTPAVTALYVLNHKRSTLVEMERRFGVAITIEADETLGAQPYLIVRGAVAEKPVSTPDAQPAPAAIVEQEDEIEVEIADEAEEETVEQTRSDHHGQGDHDRDRKRRRRRRRRGGRDHEHGGDHEHSDEHRHEGHASAQDSASDKAATDGEAERANESAEDGDQAAPADADGDRKKRRRGKRGGRRNRNEAGAEAQAEGAAEPAGGAEAEYEGDGSSADAAPQAEQSAKVMPEASIEADVIAEEPAPETSSRRSRRSAPAEQAPAAADEPAINGADVASETGDSGSRVHRTRRREGADAPASEPTVVSNVEAAGSEAKPRKGGWWQRKGFF